MASPQDFQTFVFFDVETTGLPYDKPCVAELCFFAVNRCSLQNSPQDFLQTPQPPRIVDKLTFCIDPQKPFTAIAEEITGLSNHDLEENCKPKFNTAVVEVLRGFLDRQTGPICLVAHNGFPYDFPLLRTELQRVGADLPPDTGCLDTLPVFRKLDKAADVDKAAKVSYKLGEIYRRFYGQEPTRAHSAEGDVLTLLLVFLAKAPELMEQAAKEARKWGDIQPMYVPEPEERKWPNLPKDLP
ncbi:three prime repair exonuclease 2-like [Hemicordylus capensis]|uniref:three prime repair exonuclease 2-like n=1 Tax=Hemicordylus capensis TaxID=884348 RepID=UPI0023032D57|nr:three prime repair exonuclease 2-like [Hemicordylus capensis]XP_053155811.1 three prime repair exonuclease 2-like [Hemicordylus capensis]XP_053155812.1 three prime repair exonuclease 2-like [Hemicordylus capensis]